MVQIIGLAKILDEAKSLQDGEALEGERSLTGTVASILGEYSEATKTISFIVFIHLFVRTLKFCLIFNI